LKRLKSNWRRQKQFTYSGNGCTEVLTEDIQTERTNENRQPNTDGPSADQNMSELTERLDELSHEKMKQSDRSSRGTPDPAA
jgi:hypothetical protein